MTDRFSDLQEDEYHTQWELFQRPFVQTRWKSTKTLFRRQTKITKRLYALIKLRLLQVKFYHILHTLPLYMLQRPIFYKHKAQRFFRTSSYVVAHCMVNLPRTLIEVMVSIPQKK